jgi:hypothetical protein
MKTVREEMRNPIRRKPLPQDARARKLCVETVWARENARCQNPHCRRYLVRPNDAYALNADNVGHVHEEPPRSRGGDPHNPDHCVLVCNACHERLHLRRKPWLAVIIEDREQGTRGPLRWMNREPRKSGKTLAEVFAEEARSDGDEPVHL